MGGAFEQELPSDQEVEHDSQAPDVHLGAIIGLAQVDLWGRK
jgi:hypothetical protein